MVPPVTLMVLSPSTAVVLMVPVIAPPVVKLIVPAPVVLRLMASEPVRHLTAYLDQIPPARRISTRGYARLAHILWPQLFRCFF